MPAPLGKTPDEEDAQHPGVRPRGLERHPRRAPLLPRAAHRRPLRRPPQEADRRRRSCGGSSTGSAPQALLDTEGRAYRDAGLAYLATDAAAITQRMLADVRLLRLPLVRYGDDVTAGKAEDTWKAWLARPR